VAAALLLAVQQAILLAGREGGLAPAARGGPRRFVEEFSVHFEFLEEDRPLDLPCAAWSIRSAQGLVLYWGMDDENDRCRSFDARAVQPLERARRATDRPSSR